MTGVIRLYERNQIRNQIKLEVEIKNNPHTVYPQISKYIAVKENMLNPLRLHV